MSNFTKAILNIRETDEIACKNTPIHRIYPLIKLITLLIFIIIVISFNRYEVIGLLPLIIYPVIIMALSEVPLKYVLKKILLIQPFIIGLGILNPLFDRNIVNIAGFTINCGWLTFISVLLKCSLTVSATLLFIATTGLNKTGYSLRILKIPGLFVLQFLLTFRYISLLIEEASRISIAYSLRAGGHKGIHISALGSLLGQLLLRTYDRAENIYSAMCLRGFTGEYHIGTRAKIKPFDLLFAFIWISFFIFTRYFNLPEFLGLIITGVIIPKIIDFDSLPKIIFGASRHFILSLLVDIKYIRLLLNLYI